MPTKIRSNFNSGSRRPTSQGWSGAGSFGTYPSNSWSGAGLFGSFPSKSWSGAGATGTTYPSQSWSGAGSVNSITYSFCGNISAQNNTQYGGFYNFLLAPASDMTLWDINAGVNGYFRAKMSNLMHFWLEGSLAGNTYQVDIGLVRLGEWTWLTGGTASETNTGKMAMSGQIIRPGQVTSAQNFQSGTVGNNSASAVAAVLGDGDSLSSAYLNMPNTANYRKSKIYTKNLAINATQPPYQHLLAQPTADISPGGGILEIYNGRQTVGSAASITDSGGSSFDLVPDGNGYTVYLDGPYAS